MFYEDDPQRSAISLESEPFVRKFLTSAILRRLYYLYLFGLFDSADNPLPEMSLADYDLVYLMSSLMCFKDVFPVSNSPLGYFSL